METQSVGGSCGAGQPASQSANGQSLLYGLQVSTFPGDLRLVLLLGVRWYNDVPLL